MLMAGTLATENILSHVGQWDAPGNGNPGSLEGLMVLDHQHRPRLGVPVNLVVAKFPQFFGAEAHQGAKMNHVLELPCGDPQEF